jgi:tetratricopeptide (TPR) repeat protein
MKPGVRALSALAALFAWSCVNPVPPVPTVSVAAVDPDVRDAISKARAQAVAQPKNGQASGRLGMVLEANTLYAPAALAYQRAIRLEPKEFAWRYYLALTLQQQFKLQEALDAVSAALSIRPNYSAAILKRGELLLKLGRLQESSATLETLLAQDPKSPVALYALARVKYAQEALPAAEDFYRRACQAYPTFGAAYYGLGVTEKRLGHQAESAKNFALAERYNGESPPVEDPLLGQMSELATGLLTRLRQADDMLHQGQLQEASRLFQEVLKRDPSNMDSMLNILYLAPLVGQPSGEEVESLYLRARRINPQIPKLYLFYGSALTGQEHYDAAVTAVKKAIELKPDYAEAYVVLGGMLEKHNRPAEAIEDYRLALAAQPSYRAAHLQLGRILVSQGRDREAIPELLPALQVDDSDTSLVMLLLAQAYANSGDLDKARDYLKQARVRALKTGPPGLVQQIDQGLTQLGSRP